jgi:hypothetical protein
MSETDTTETVATFTRDGKTYEIDHLGIDRPGGSHDLDHGQWGEFQVYCAGKSVAYFAIEESALKPAFRPAELPVTTEDLIRLAREAVAIEEAHDLAGEN